MIIPFVSAMMMMVMMLVIGWFCHLIRNSRGPDQPDSLPIASAGDHGKTRPPAGSARGRLWAITGKWMVKIDDDYEGDGDGSDDDDMFIFWGWQSSSRNIPPELVSNRPGRHLDLRPQSQVKGHDPRPEEEQLQQLRGSRPAEEGVHHWRPQVVLLWNEPQPYHW